MLKMDKTRRNTSITAENTQVEVTWKELLSTTTIDRKLAYNNMLVQQQSFNNIVKLHLFAFYCFVNFLLQAFI